MKIFDYFLGDNLKKKILEEFLKSFTRKILRYHRDIGYNFAALEINAGVKASFKFKQTLRLLS